MPEACPAEVKIEVKIMEAPDFAQKVRLIKTISHPVRLMILEELTQGVKCVSDLEDFLKIRQPNVSQHLSVLRAHNIVDYFLDGRLRCYFLKSAFVPELLKLLKADMGEELPAPMCCPVTKKGKYPGKRKN